MEIFPLNNKRSTLFHLPFLPVTHQTNPEVNKGQRKDLDNDEALKKKIEGGERETVK